MSEQRIRIFNAGSYIYVEGDDNVNDIYIVEQGMVEFTALSKRVLPYKNAAKPGDIFGFISSLCGRPRMESARAKVTSKIIIFTKDRFLALMQKNKRIAVKLLNMYAEELRIYDMLIFPMEGNNDLFSPDEIRLYKIGKYYFEKSDPLYAFYVMKRYLSMYPQGTFSDEIQSMMNILNKKGTLELPELQVDGMTRSYGDKQIIFCESEPGEEMYLIQKGRVKIVKTHEDAEILLSVLKEGDIFGELAIISQKSRNATAISYGPTTVVSINKKNLMAVIEKSPQLLKKIFNAISQRVWFTFIRVEARIYDKPITRIYTFLENKLLEDNIPPMSKESYTVNFGIDELVKITHITPEGMTEAMNELMRDGNLAFNLGQIMIDNPSLVASKARYHKSRDHLYETEDKSAEDEISADAHHEELIEDMDLAEAEKDGLRADDLPASEKSTLFEELEKDLS